MAQHSGVALADVSSNVSSPIPISSRAITAKDLVELKDIGGGYEGAIGVSPDGKEVAYLLSSPDLAANTYHQAWYVAPTTESGRPLRVGDGGDVQLSVTPDGRTAGVRPPVAPKWSHNGQWIAYKLKRGDAVQLWRSRRDGLIQEQLTHNAADVMEFQWSADSSKLFYTVGRSREAMAKADAAEARTGYLFDERFWLGDALHPLWSACGSHTSSSFFRGSDSQRCDPELRVKDLIAGQERPATVAEQSDYNAIAFPNRPSGIDVGREIRTVLRSASGIAWLENADPKTFPGINAPLTIFALARGADSNAILCPAEVCRGQIQKLWWHKREVVFLRREGHKDSVRAVYAWSPGQNTVRTILRTDDHIYGCDIQGGRFICLHEGPIQPRRIVAVDLKRGTMTPLVDPNPFFQDIQFTRVEKLEWDDGFGNDVFGHLVYPQRYQVGTRYPLVIVQYRSSGFLRGGVGDEYPIHILAAQGFAVLSFDRPDASSLYARVSDIEEIVKKEWENLYKRRRALQALERVVADLDRKGIIDPTRVGLTGLSDGAETVDFALINSSYFAVMASSGNAWNPSTYYLSGRLFQEYVAKHLGHPQDPKNRWKDMSVGLNLERVRVPILFQVADHEVLYEAFNYVALRDAGKAVEMHIFPNEYHSKWQPVHRYSIYRRNAQWFLFWLQGVEVDDPVDANQYIRWRKLREVRDAGTQSN